MAIAPIITFPTTDSGYSTNLQHQTIQGTADTSITSILVNGSTAGVTYTSGATGWVFNTNLQDGANVFNVMAYDGVTYSSPDTLTISYTSDENLNLIVTSPTGFSVDRAIDSVTLIVVQNPESLVIGYNFYASESAGGGLTGYTLLNSSLVTQFDYYQKDTELVSSVTTTSGDTQTTVTVENVKKNYYYSYTHNRVTNYIGTAPITEPNYYVVTAVAYDPSLKQQVESMFSAELPGTPITLNSTINQIQPRVSLDIQQSYISTVLNTDATIDVKPGTVTRDIHINPPSDEFSRLYVIQDFLHTSQSFITLLNFDDSNGDQVSDPVLESTQKIILQNALLISDTNVSQVQNLIDSAFDKLAGNVNVTRKGNQAALGQVLFYTIKNPTRDVVITAGAVVQTTADDTTAAVQFKTLVDFTMFFNTRSQYYNATTKRYEFTLDIQAVIAGSSGNVEAYRIDTVVSGVDNILKVANINPTEFGQDSESNYNLAQRALLAYVGVDSGTASGYLSTTLSTPNISKCKIVSAGDSLMQRDLDPLRLVHTKGKVDIYLQGSKEITYTENFGFIYTTVTAERAQIQSVPYFQFKSLNTAVTVNTPIYTVTAVKNVTKAANYDITDFIISGDGNVIVLDPTLTANVSIGLASTDIITISYRYRASDPYIFNNQPATSITSVTGEFSDLLDPANYILDRSEDPLTTGNSTASQDKMNLVYYNGKPSGDINQIVGEAHILSGEEAEPLVRYGIISSTIVVTDALSTITYTRDVDYTVIEGDMKNYTHISRISTGIIVPGETVLVNYDSGENFIVVYTVNSLLNTVQNKVNTMKHLTADVIVKDSIKTYIDFDLNVLLVSGSDQTSIDKKIRTAIAKLLSDKNVGDSVYQSEVVYAIESISGVAYVVLPFNKMVRADGSIILRELYNGSWGIYQTVVVTAYKSNVALSWPTVESGAPLGSFSGVYENDYPLTLVSSLDDIALSAGNAYISSDGYIYVTFKHKTVSTATIKVTYVVNGAVGTRNISFSAIEYGAVGSLTISYNTVN